MDYEKIIWENEKLENALDKILIEYEDKIFDKWLMQEFASLQESDKKIEEIEAFEFCGWTPMEWAKQYCEDVADDIDIDLNEDYLINYLIDYCNENMMQDMYIEADIDCASIIKAIA